MVSLKKAPEKKGPDAADKKTFVTCPPCEAETLVLGMNLPGEHVMAAMRTGLLEIHQPIGLRAR